MNLRKLLGLPHIPVDKLLTAGEVFSLTRRWSKDSEGLASIARPTVVLLLTSEMVFSALMESFTDWYVVPEGYRNTLDALTIATIAGYFGFRTLDKWLERKKTPN